MKSLLILLSSTVQLLPLILTCHQCHPPSLASAFAIHNQRITSTRQTARTKQDSGSSKTLLWSATTTRGGGRAPSEADRIQEQQLWQAEPNEDGECRLIICQITDGKFVSFVSLRRVFNGKWIPNSV